MKKSELIAEEKLSDHELSRRTILQLATAIAQAQGSLSQLLTRSFLSGLFTAVGATIGFALFVILLGYILKLLGVIPGLSTITHAIQDFVVQYATRK